MVQPFLGTSRVGDKNDLRVRVVQHRLNALGCGPIAVDGVFGAETLRSAQLLQARSVDSLGRPLVIDGIVGAATWGALFNQEPASVEEKPRSPLLFEVLQFARSAIGARENPPGSNRGPEVDTYLRAVGLNPGAGSFPWCAAFVYWCFDQAATRIGRYNPCVKTAGVLEHWRVAGERGIRRYGAEEAQSDPEAVWPGLVFAIRTGPVQGHMGIVESVSLGLLTTIEGNTNEGGSREGVGVFRRRGRTVASINLGFIDYGSVPGAPL